ncbi:MAG TPA: hypothetical protein PLB92_05910 [Rhodoglobus sp.]|nr:hypothetical protein [Rhodoglobus sp.]
MSTAFEREFGVTAFDTLKRAVQHTVESHEQFPLYDLYGRPRLSRPPLAHVRVRTVPAFLEELTATGNVPPAIIPMPDGREIPVVYDDLPPVPPDVPAARWVGANVTSIAEVYGEPRSFMGAIIALPEELWRET